MKNKILLSLLLFLVSLSGFTQETKKWKSSYTYRHFGMQDGLIPSPVTYSFQDSFGYIWFSSFDGVSRFDGTTFQNYMNREIMADSYVRYMNQYEDTVYFVSGNAVIFLSPDGKIDSYRIPDRYGISHEPVKASGDYVYLFNCHQPEASGMKDLSIFSFDLKNKRFKRLDAQTPHRVQVHLSGNYILTYSRERYELEPDQTDKVIIFKINGEDLIPVNLFDKEENTGFVSTSRNEMFFRRYNRSAITADLYSCAVQNDSLIYNYITTYSYRNCEHNLVAERLDAERIFFSICKDDEFYHFLDKDQLMLIPVPMLGVWHAITDRDGHLWVSTAEGVYCFYRLFVETYSLGLSHNDNIWAIRKDRYGNTWFSSFGLGFWKVDKQGVIHPAQVYSEGRKIVEKGGYMSSCEDESGKLYFTSGQGIAVFDPEKGNTNRLDMLNTGVTLATFYDTLTHSVFFGGRTEITNLTRLDSTGKLSIYPLDNRHIISICRDARQRLRIGTWRGEAILDETEGKIVSDMTQRDYKGLISMELDNEGFLWKGTTEGLFVEDRQGKDTLISGEDVNFVLCYKDKYVIWGHIHCIYFLDLAAFHKDRTLSIRTIDSYYGFNLMECVQNGGYIDSEGWVWITGAREIVRFLPERFMQISPIQLSKPCIAAIYNSGKDTQWELVDSRNPFVFENDRNFLRFDILQAAVAAPEKLVFRYRLEGFQKQWTTSRDRSPVFQNLPHGKFRLEIQSSLDGEQWSESVFSSPVTIRPPFGLTFPGLLLIALGIAGISALIIYYTRKITIRKEEEMRKIDQLKLRAVQAKFIPHFTGNVLNSINYLISKNPDLAQKYISNFADFSHHTLLNSDNLCRTIQAELDYTLLYLKLEKLRFDEKLDYEIEVSPEVDKKKLIPTMVLQTFCENALKHGLLPKPEGGKIRIRVYREGAYVALTVEDNGVGREKAQAIKTEGTKEGLKIVQQQLAIFNKNQTSKAYMQIVDLFDDSGDATCRVSTGTRMKLYVP